MYSLSLSIFHYSERMAYLNGAIEFQSVNPLTPTVALSVRVPGCQKLQMMA